MLDIFYYVMASHCLCGPGEITSPVMHLSRQLEGAKWRLRGGPSRPMAADRGAQLSQCLFSKPLGGPNEFNVFPNVTLPILMPLRRVDAVPYLAAQVSAHSKTR